MKKYYKINKIQQTNKDQQMSQINKRREVIFYEYSSFDKSDSINKSTSNYERPIKMSKSKNESDSQNKRQSLIESLEAFTGLIVDWKGFKDQDLTDLMNLIQNIQNESDSKDEIILDLQVRLEKQMISKDGRKAEVLNLLKENESISILELASQINISTKNVSSQLTYLRSDGYKIFTDHKGRKVLMNK